MYVLTYLELKQFKNCNEATVHWSTIRNEAEVSSRESVVSVLNFTDLQIISHARGSEGSFRRNMFDFLGVQYDSIQSEQIRRYSVIKRGRRLDHKSLINCDSIVGYKYISFI